MPVATPAMVAAELGRDLTPAEQSRVTDQIAAAVQVIEATLNRAVEVQQWVERRTPLLEGMGVPHAHNGWSTLTGGQIARVVLARRPVRTLVKVLAEGVGDVTANCRLDGDSVLVPTPRLVEITYTAGDDPVSPLVRTMVVRALTREMFQPAAVASGAYSAYSVEGSSFTAATPAPEATWPFTTQEMRALGKSMGKMTLR